ncbi:MAG: type IV pilus modification protein PilV [Gammaproteobacteria bacterium]|nr:type IV pilus modification protein PilV [Gammaproteobacteria bacterium]
MRHAKGHPGLQRGFGLIEVLITMLVLAVGMLAAASLELFSKRSNFDAAQRTAAANLAQDLLERMRSNPKGLIDYIPAAEIGGGTLANAPPSDCGDPATACDATDVANFDLWQWEQAVDGAMEQTDGVVTGGLAQPTACIAGPLAGGSGNYEVAIAWRGMNETTDPDMDDCGAGSGKYGDDDTYRRVLVIRTFISAT